MKTLVDEVDVGSRQQSTGIDQIGKAICQMEQVTHKTAADSEESAASAQELNARWEACARSQHVSRSWLAPEARYLPTTPANSDPISDRRIR